MGEGLRLGIYGIGITFLTLGALIVLIRGLVWLANGPQQAATEENPPDEPPSSEQVAAIAAWWYLNQKSQPPLGARLTEKPGRWWDKKD